MTLRDIIKEVELLSDDLVVFATKKDDWDVDGLAALVISSDMTELGIHLEDLSYFLEVEIAKEVVQVWREWNGKEANESERIEALIYYANNDAFLGS